MPDRCSPDRRLITTVKDEHAVKRGSQDRRGAIRRGTLIDRLRQRLRQLGRELLHQHTQPGELAAAVLLGCVVGCTPLFGLHLPLCIALAWLFGLNQLVVYGAANISIPPLVPFLGLASVEIGERLLHGRWLTLDAAYFRASPTAAVAHFFGAWLLGGIILGVLIGGIAAGSVYVWARRKSANQTVNGANAPNAPHSIEHAIDQANHRYRGVHPRFRWYARIKYRLDPCYRAIVPLVPEGAFAVDLGCGLGMLPVLLGLCGRRALGVEWDPAKVACGLHAARGLDVRVVSGDAHEFDLPACDVITLIDVLHYYPADRQRTLLHRCRAALRAGGRLLVRDIDGSRGGAAGFTRWFERTSTRLGLNRGPEVRFRPIAALRADLEALGFVVHSDEMSGQFLPGNVLLVADLRPDGGNNPAPVPGRLSPSSGTPRRPAS